MRDSASRKASQPSEFAPPQGTIIWLRPLGLNRRTAPHLLKLLQTYSADLFDPSARKSCLGPLRNCSYHTRSLGIRFNSHLQALIKEYPGDASVSGQYNKIVLWHFDHLTHTHSSQLLHRRRFDLRLVLVPHSPND